MKRKKIICFDLDNVICRTPVDNNYNKSIPIKKNIKKINEIYNQGYYVKIFTARYMGRCRQNVNLAKKSGYKFTLNQLKKWNVKYHKLIFGKPSYDLFIDDKNLGHKNNWSTFIVKHLPSEN